MNNELAKMETHAEIARNEYDKYVNDQINLGPDYDINWDNLDYLGKRANDAEFLAKAARCALQNCTCVLPEHSCPACREYQRKKHGDSIPFGGE